MNAFLLIDLLACSPNRSHPVGDGDSAVDTGSDPDGYPKERGFEFDGAWYADTAEIAKCALDAGALSTYADGARAGTGEHATAAWLFAGLPLPGTYTTSPSGGAVGASEAELVISDMRDDSRWLTDALAGSVTVYAPGAGALDVVWHDVSLSTASGELGVTPEGWTSCTLPPL